MPRWRRIEHFAHVAVQTLSAKGFFAPQKPAAHFYAAAFALCACLLGAAYIANSAAIFAAPALFSATVKSLGDFKDGASCCVLNRTDDQAFMAQFYPATPLTVLDSDQVVDLLTAVAAGACAGGVAPDVELAHALTATGNNAWCSLERFGAAVASGAFAIPLNAATVSPSLVDAANIVISAAVADAAVTAELVAHDGGGPRGSCSAEAAAAPPQLSVVDMAGVFVIQAVGLGAALIIWGTAPLRKHVKKKAAQHLAQHVARLSQTVLSRLPTVKGGDGAAAAANGAEQATESGAVEEGDAAPDAGVGAAVTTGAVAVTPDSPVVAMEVASVVGVMALALVCSAAALLLLVVSATLAVTPPLAALVKVTATPLAGRFAAAAMPATAAVYAAPLPATSCDACVELTPVSVVVIVTGADDVRPEMVYATPPSRVGNESTPEGVLVVLRPVHVPAEPIIVGMLLAVMLTVPVVAPVDVKLPYAHGQLSFLLLSLLRKPMLPEASIRK